MVLTHAFTAKFSIAEKRLAYDHKFYLERMVKEGGVYVSNLQDNPLKPVAAIPHAISETMKATTDLVRLVQKDPRPIPNLRDRMRVTDSLLGAGEDVVGGVRDLFRGDLLSFVGKEIGAVLQIGDAAIGAVADGTDAAFGVDLDRQKSSYYSAA